MTWPSLAAAGRALEAAFEFGPDHQLFFVKTDAKGRLQDSGSYLWAVQVFYRGKLLGWLSPFRMIDGRAEFA